MLRHQQETENAYWELIESQNMDFLLQEEANLFLVGKNMLIVMVPILINKDVFEPGYSDLKVTVQNCSYFLINLIRGLQIFSPIPWAAFSFCWAEAF